MEKENKPLSEKEITLFRGTSEYYPDVLDVEDVKQAVKEAYEELYDCIPSSICTTNKPCNRCIISRVFKDKFGFELE